MADDLHIEPRVVTMVSPFCAYFIARKHTRALAHLPVGRASIMYCPRCLNKHSLWVIQNDPKGSTPIPRDMHKTVLKLIKD